MLIKREHQTEHGAAHSLLESSEAVLIWRITTHSKAAAGDRLLEPGGEDTRLAQTYTCTSPTGARPLLPLGSCPHAPLTEAAGMNWASCRDLAEPVV